MLPFLKNVGGFLHKNRNKLVIASIIAISVAVVVHYNSSSTEDNLILNSEEIVNENISSNDDELIEREKPNRKMSPVNRSRLLLRIRRQFDIASQHFMPTLRIKIIEVVDINGTVRQIKELRSKSNENSRQLEAQLWEEIKISSFTMLFVTAYMLSAVCVMLRVQLHVLARSAYHGSSSSGQFNEDLEVQLDNDMFKALVEATYKQMFGSGLRTFAALVKSRVSADLRHWTVQEKLSVEFGDLLETVSLVRRNIEVDLAATVQTIFIRKRFAEFRSPVTDFVSLQRPQPATATPTTATATSRPSAMARSSATAQTEKIVIHPLFLYKNCLIRFVVAV